MPFVGWPPLRGALGLPPGWPAPVDKGLPLGLQVVLSSWWPGSVGAQVTRGRTHQGRAGVALCFSWWGGLGWGAEGGTCFLSFSIEVKVTSQKANHLKYAIQWHIHYMCSCHL